MNKLLGLLLASVLVSISRAATTPLESTVNPRADGRQTYDGGLTQGNEPVQAAESQAVKPVSSRDKYIFVAQKPQSETAAPSSKKATPAPAPAPKTETAAAADTEPSGPSGGFGNGAKWGAGLGWKFFKLMLYFAAPFLLIPVVGWFVAAALVILGAAVGLIIAVLMGLFGGIAGAIRR